MRVGKQRQYGEEGEEVVELMSESYSRRSWKGIAIAFLVIGAVAAIVTLVVLYSGSQSPWTVDGTLTLADVINGKYSPKSFSSSVWSSGDTFMYLDNGSLWSFNITRNTSEIVLPNSTLGPGLSSFYPSPSEKYILYPVNITKQFRYSYNASFEVVAPYNQHLMKQFIADGKVLQLASWGPSEDDIVYVLENDIYYLKTYDGKEVQVTHDGVPGIIFNGVPDWVYEEEVLGSTSAIWWSPSGTYFAFLKFNDTDVRDMHYMQYGNTDEVYPNVIDVKYPKPGFSNPKVSLWIVNTSNPAEVQRVKFEDENAHYVTEVTWAKDDTLAVMWGPRVQNQSFVSLCKKGGTDWTCAIDSKEASSGWLDPRPILFQDDGKVYYIIKSNNQFKHIHMNYVQDSARSNFITSGPNEVTDLVFLENDNVYYIRTDGPEKRRFYRITKASKEPKEECLSCYSDCDWASASMSPGGKYYALTCSSPTTVPTVELYQVDTNKPVKLWVDNQDLKDKLANQTLSKYIDYQIPVSSSDPKGDSIKIRVSVPKNFSESKRYPALIYVYGGPGSQMIQNTFGIDFGTYLVTNKNYLYIEVDGRGSGFRGDKILYSMYKKLGTVEIQDQISAMRFLLRNHSFVDPSRVAIWGWSYGGYAAAMTLAQGKDIFTCAMSVAPVTNWRYYDSIYTERFMLEPKDNQESYRTSQLMNYVNNFKSKQFLLLHGTADDNVHIQQTMMLTKALNNASILFDMHIYPDENHSIPKSKLHVYMTLEDFLSDCFS